MLFSAEIYIDPITLNHYSVFRCITDFTKEERFNLPYEMCSSVVFGSALSGWFIYFVPIITAFCSTPVACTEREENALRFQIFRCSKVKYNAVQFISGIISAGAAVLIGYLIFCGIVSAIFPNTNDYSAEIAQNLTDWLNNYPTLILGVFCEGVYSSIPSMFLSCVIRNKYLIMCIPFFLKYGLTQIYISTISNAMNADNMYTKYKLAMLLNPDGVLRLSKSNILNVFLLFGRTGLALFIAYMIVTSKWSDCGA